MSSAALPAPRAHLPVLADLVSRGAALPRALTDTLLVLGGTAFVAVLAQVVVPLPFTPVPITLSSFAVLVTGASLGSLRGSLSMLLYVLLGVAGAPLFGEGGSGWAFASFGYILAYLPAAALAGYLARKGQDRTPLGTIGLVTAASAVIYAGGVPWLMVFLDVPFTTALSLGMTPFLVGDAVKAVALCALLPTTWAVLRRVTREQSASSHP